MVKILADTNVWLHIVEDSNEFDLLDIVQLLVRERLVTLVVPTALLNEFAQLRDGAAAKCAKSLHSHIQAVRDVVTYAGGDPTTVRLVLQHLEHVNNQSDARIRIAELMLKRVEKLLAQFPPVPPSQDVQLACFLRAQRRMAPFHEDQNEIIDALLIETYAECIRLDPNPAQEYMFISRDISAFSQSKANRTTPHGDYDCFDSVRSRYFITLADAIGHIRTSPEVKSLLDKWVKTQRTVADLINQFLDEVKVGDSHYYCLARTAQMPIGRKPAATITSKDVMDHCKLLLTEVEPSTVKTYVGHLKTMLRHAEEHWGDQIPLDAVDRASAYVASLLAKRGTEPRGRLPTEQEYATVLKYYQQRKRPANEKVNMVDVLEFMVATGRRIGHIGDLRWKNVALDHQSCTFTEGGETVPLPPAAQAIIKRYPRGDDDARVFRVQGETVSKSFTTLAKKQLRLHEIILDDFRKLGFERMWAAGMQPHEVALLSGRNDLSALFEEHRNAQRRRPS